MKRVLGFLEILFRELKGRLISTALFKIFGRALGGFWGWLLTLLGEKVIDKVVKPGFDFVVRKTWTMIKKIGFKKKGKDLVESKNERDFDRNFDDLP